MRCIVLMVAALTALSAGCAIVDAPSIDPGLPVSFDTPRLTWPEIEGAVRYQVQLCRNHDFAREVTTLPETEETAISLKGIVRYNRSYFWRVRAIDSDGFRGAWSDKGYFILRLKPPTPLGPVGEVSDQRPAFTWEKMDCAQRYVVQISTDKFFRLPEYRYETAARDYFPRPLNPDKGRKYYWRVRAIAGDGAASEWSDPVEFVVTASAPAADLSPAGERRVASLKPAFKWSGQEGALRYQIEIIRADELNSAEPQSIRLEFSKGRETTLTLRKALKPDTRYAWRVRPIMPDSPGRWSKYATFRTPEK